MLKKITKIVLGIILTLVGIYFVLSEMLALIGEHGVLFSGYNLYLFIFFMASGFLLIYFGIKLVKVVWDHR